MKKILFALLVLCCSNLNIYGQLPNFAMYDLDQSQVFGAQNTITSHHLLYKGQEWLLPAKIGKENTVGKKLIGIGYRLLKFTLLDFQADYLFLSTQKQVFGHGSRFRELGYTDNTYNISPFYPYGEGKNNSLMGVTDNIRVNSSFEELATVIGGNEAAQVLSEEMNARVLYDGKLDYREGLMYLLSNNALLTNIWLDYLRNKEAYVDGDAIEYVSQMNQKYITTDGHYTLNKLSAQSLISLLDPMQFYSLWAVGKLYLIDGVETLDKIPGIHFKETKYLPSLGYNLTPFGSEYSFSNQFIKGNRVILVDFHIGDPTFNKFSGAKLKAFNIFNSDKLVFNSQINFWNQPAFQLGGETLKNFDAGSGFMVKGDISFFPFESKENLGIFGQFGYKTAGFVKGEPLDKGVVFSAGGAMRFIDREKNRLFNRDKKDKKKK